MASSPVSRSVATVLYGLVASSAVLIGASGDFRVGREQRPAINIGISVSRVGQKLQFDELQAFAQFASDLDAATQKQLARGQRLRELLKQPPALPDTTLQQVMLIFTGTRTAIIDSIPLESVAELKSMILQATAESHQEFLADGQLDVAAIETFLLEVAKRWEAGSRDLVA